MDQQPKTAGAIRKDIYGYIAQVIGRPLTEPEHKALKEQIVEHSRLLGGTFAPPNTPIKRVWTCRDCRKSDTLNKKGDKKRRYGNKDAGISTEVPDGDQSAA